MYEKHTIQKYQYLETDCDCHPEMEVAITQRCNYNCMYCFEAADANKMTDEFTLEEFVKLMDDARDCGINCIALTGGEPMVHKNFIDFLDIINERDLGISEIMTNGSLISDDFLKYLKTIPAASNTKFCISFDGLNGKHNKIRQTNSENVVLNNIKKCLEYGFDVKITYNLSKFNINELKDTTILLNNMGIKEFRIARTMPAPKWNLFAPGTEISHKEWLDMSVEYVKWYTKQNMKMKIDVWNACIIYPDKKYIILNNIKSCGNKDVDDNRILCPLTSMRICVCGDGMMVPCHQVSGILRFEGIDLGNVKQEGLYSILKDSKWKELINTKVTERLKYQEKCKKCEFWSMCLGGCPVIGAPWRWEYGEKFPFSTDVTQCAFFEGGYLDIFKKEVVSRGWHLPIFFGMPLPSFDTPGRTRMELRK